LGIDLGFFRYLTKPIKVNEFMETLNEALEFSKINSNLSDNKDALPVLEFQTP
jgi:DNA-binding NtrC family response regulator